MGDNRLSNSLTLRLLYQQFRWTHCIHFPGRRSLWNICSCLHSKCHSSLTYNDYTSWLHTWEIRDILHPLTCIKHTLEKREERKSEGRRGGGGERGEVGGHISDKFLCSSDNYTNCNMSSVTFLFQLQFSLQIKVQHLSQ